MNKLFGENPEIDPSKMESAEVIRNGVISALVNGVEGTTKDIPDIEAQKASKYKLQLLLKYSSETTHHARMLAGALASPRDFRLVDAEKLGLPADPEAQSGNVIYQEENAPIGKIHSYQFPTEITSPYLNPFQRHKSLNETFSPDVQIRLEFYAKNGKVKQGKLDYRFNPANPPWPVGNPEALAVELKRRGKESYPTFWDTELLYPHKHSLLTFHYFPERMDPNNLHAKILSSPYEQMTTYVKDAEKKNGFDVLTVAYNKKAIMLDTQKSLATERDPDNRSFCQARLMLYESIREDPSFQIIGIGKVKIDGQDFYIYTGADKGGISVPEKEQSRIAVPSLMPNKLSRVGVPAN
jgi:hypothetical protein